MVNDYFEEYHIIGFRVCYSYRADHPERLSFAAHPMEELDNLENIDDVSCYLFFGYTDAFQELHIGSRGFLVKMTADLHERLGKLHNEILREFIDRYERGV